MDAIAAASIARRAEPYSRLDHYPCAAASSFPLWRTFDEEIVIDDSCFRWIGAQAHRRRLTLDPDLQAYDRLNRGVIPGTMFERALGVLGLLPGRRK